VFAVPLTKKLATRNVALGSEAGAGDG